MRMTIVSAAIVAMSYHAVLSADLPSAEETVAFILYGFEDGEKLFSGDKELGTISQTAKSPAGFRVLPSPQSELTVTDWVIKETSKCVFRITLDEKEKPSSSGTVDFNNLLDVTFYKGYGELSFSGACPIKDDNGKCTSTHFIDTEMGTPAQRIQKAIAYMKTTYCSGSAF